MDPNHVNFLDADGHSRIGMLAHVQYNANTSSMEDVVKTKFYDASTLPDFTTDTPTTFHGTHTMGIMAGGYRGPAKVALEEPDGSVSMADDIPCPFYGVATEASIAAAALGNLDDIFIAYGTDFILQYAELMQQPYVVNISLGSNTGPHDGSSLIGQFFDLCAEDGAIICVSAGNSGDVKIAATKTLTAEDAELKTFIEGYDVDFDTYTAHARQGNITIYSQDESSFEVQAVIYNKTRGTITKRYALTVDESTRDTGKYWVSSSDYVLDETDIIDTTFKRYFEGSIGLGWSVDSDNGRFYTIVDYTAIDNPENNADGNYALGFIITGTEGQRLNAFCDGTFSFMSDNGVEGWDDGSTNGSINDMACSKSVIAVGAYNSACQWAALDGNSYAPAWHVEPDDITEISGYGTLNDGRNLPLVCAPGAVIMSSTNSYYVAASDEADATARGAMVERPEGPTNFWEATSGTSMASPYLAGTIALWLEADPSLSLEEVKDIICTTAVRDEAVLAADAVKAGAGKLDAYAGLKEVLRRKAEAGMAPVVVSSTRMLVRPCGDRLLDIMVPGATSLDVCLTDMAGKVVLRQHVEEAGEATVNVASLLPGTYIIAAGGHRAKCFIP